MYTQSLSSCSLESLRELKIAQPRVIGFVRNDSSDGCVLEGCVDSKALTERRKDIGQSYTTSAAIAT